MRALRLQTNTAGSDDLKKANKEMLEKVTNLQNLLDEQVQATNNKETEMFKIKKLLDEANRSNQQLSKNIEELYETIKSQAFCSARKREAAS